MNSPQESQPIQVSENGELDPRQVEGLSTSEKPLDRKYRILLGPYIMMDIWEIKEKLEALRKERTEQGISEPTSEEVALVESLTESERQLEKLSS